MKEHLPALMAFLPLAGAWATLALGWMSYRLSRWAGYGTLLATLYLTLSSFPKVLEHGPWHYSLGGWAPPWGIELVLAPLSGRNRSRMRGEFGPTFSPCACRNFT